jgi:hypothetical protein
VQVLDCLCAQKKNNKIVQVLDFLRAQPGSAHGDTPGIVCIFRRDCTHARVQLQSNTNMPTYTQYQKVRNAHRRSDHSLFLVSHCSQIIHPACAHLSYKNNGTRTRAHADRHTHTRLVGINAHACALASVWWAQMPMRARGRVFGGHKCPCVRTGACLVGTN